MTPTYLHQQHPIKAVADALGLNLRVDPTGSASSDSVDVGIDAPCQDFSVPYLEQSGILASTPSTASTPDRKPHPNVDATGRDVDANRGTDQGHKEALLCHLRQSSGGA